MSYLDELDESQMKLIVAHLQGVIEANEETNLTRIDTFDEGMLLHVEDSLSALPEIHDAPIGRLGDLGTGGGFPGIPLAIATGRKTTLIDSRKRKIDVLQGMVRRLGLEEQVTTYAGRAELLARFEPGAFAVLTARALAQLSVLSELASPLLEDGGRLVCYKAHVEDEELSHVCELERQTGMKLVSDRSFILGEEYNRRILVFEKASKPTLKLPRREGAAQKNPL